MISYFRDLTLVFTLGDKSREIIAVKDDVYEKMKAQATKENYTEIIKSIEVLSEIEQELRYSVQPRIVRETAMIKSITESNVERRVEKLEEIVKQIKFPS